MRTPTQTGILVGAGAGLLAALLYWAMQTPALNGPLILVEILIATGAGGVAALIHVYNPALSAPAPVAAPLAAPTLPTAPPALPSERNQRVRAAATAGALAGLGWGLAGMVKVVIQITDPALATQLDSLLSNAGVQATGGGGTILGVGVLIAGCFALILFPGVGASLGAVGGYILTAVRPPATRPQ